MKLMIVDDHTVVREGLAALLRQIGPDTEILLARDADEALGQLAGHPNWGPMPAATTPVAPPYASDRAQDLSSGVQQTGLP